MVNVSIDVTDLGGEARPGDKVVFWRPRMGGSATHAGRVISTAPVTVFLTDGKATVSDVEPGEMTVLLQCRGVESQGPVTVGVPDGNGTVTLRALLESQFEYAPPIVSAVQEAASNASASEEAAIRAQVRSEAAADRADAKVDDAINNGANLVRNEVKQDADRAVSARQAAVQSESNAAASEDAAASSAANAATSETNAKQSETNAGDYAAVATTAATEAVDAMDSVSDIIGANYATREYVDNQAGSKFVGYASVANSLLRTDENGKIIVSTDTIAGDQDVVNKRYVDSASFARGTLTASHNLDAMADKKYAGAWQVTSTPVAESLGVPSPGFGTLIVFWAAGLSEPYYTATQWWVPAASGDMFKRSIVSRGSWSSWSLIGGNNQDEEVEQTAAISSSTGRADLLRASRGGRIGTGGKAVVSLRFDHNLGAFDSNILTRLRARQLPATMAFYYDMISPVPGYSNDDSAAAGKTWYGAQQNFYRGVEVFSHSYSHQDADTLDKMRREIVESRTALESAMPDVRVHGWAMPGIGGSQYMGWWSAWVDPETRLSHAAGQMLGATYGTYNVSGYGLNELGKAQTRYFGVESHTTAAASKGHIDRAIATGTGLTLMWHPNQIGADGKMSLAVFDEILDYIVAKRDAGEIMVLTMGGQAVADPSTAWRHSLVPDVGGWSGSPSGTLTYDLGLSYLHDSAGAVRMFEAEVEGTGRVRLAVQDMQANAPINVYQTQSFSGGGTARIAVGIPRRSSSIRLTLECTGVTVKKVGFYGV